MMWAPRLLVLGVILFFNSVAASTVSGAERQEYTVSIDRRPSVVVEGGTEVDLKLAPELRPAAHIGAIFRGLSAAGLPVLANGPGLKSSDLEAALAEHHLEFSKRASSEDMSLVTNILVFVRDMNAVPGNNFHGFSVIERYEPGKFIVLKSDSGGIGGEVLKQLASDENVTYVEPRFPRFTNSSTPNDPSYRDSTLWGLNEIHTSALWQEATSSSVIVAVIDTGVDTMHEDLVANVVQPGMNLIDKGTAPRDDSGHGTHVSGIIGAIGNNSLGVTGVGWSLRVLPIKVFPASGRRSDSAGFDDDVAKAIDYALLQGARVINLSFDGPNFGRALRDAIVRASAAGAIVVASAGNEALDIDDVPVWPASYRNDNLITVCAVDRDHNLADFSNYGTASVSLCAPGVSILSTLPHSKYDFLSGTSQAAPYVAGAVAMVWSLPRYRDMSAADIKKLLLSHVQAYPALSDKCQSGGVLDLSFLSTAGGVSSAPSTLTEAEQGVVRMDKLTGHILINGKDFGSSGESAAASVLSSFVGESITVMRQK